MDCDGIIFGGTDDELHFFMVLLFLEDKQVFIFDPSEGGTTLGVVAKFLYLLFQHSEWLESGSEEFRDCKDYTFSEKDKKDWDVFEVDSETKDMLKMMDFQSIPGLQLASSRGAGANFRT